MANEILELSMHPYKTFLLVSYAETTEPVIAHLESIKDNYEGDDREAIKDGIHGLKEGRQYEGRTYYNNHLNLAVVVVRPNKNWHSVLAHELLHVVLFIMDRIGCEVSDNVSEPSCYLLEWSMQKCIEFIEGLQTPKNTCAELLKNISENSPDPGQLAFDENFNPVRIKFTPKGYEVDGIEYEIGKIYQFSDDGKNWYNGEYCGTSIDSRHVAEIGRKKKTFAYIRLMQNNMHEPVPVEVDDNDNPVLSEIKKDNIMIGGSTYRIGCKYQFSNDNKNWISGQLHNAYYSFQHSTQLAFETYIDGELKNFSLIRKIETL